MLLPIYMVCQCHFQYDKEDTCMNAETLSSVCRNRIKVNNVCFHESNSSQVRISVYLKVWCLILLRMYCTCMGSANLCTVPSVQSAWLLQMPTCGGGCERGEICLGDLDGGRVRSPVPATSSFMGGAGPGWGLLPRRPACLFLSSDGSHTLAHTHTHRSQCHHAWFILLVMQNDICSWLWFMHVCRFWTMTLTFFKCKIIKDRLQVHFVTSLTKSLSHLQTKIRIKITIMTHDMQCVK